LDRHVFATPTQIEQATDLVEETDFDTELLLLLRTTIGDACRSFEVESMHLEDETIRGRVSILDECPDVIADSGVALQDRAVLLGALVRVPVGQNEPTAAVVEVDPEAGEQAIWKTEIESV
jgi:hypothetical protein